MKIQRIIKWLRREIQQSIAGDVDQRKVGVKPDRKSEDKFGDDSSYNWEAADRNESSDSNKDTPKPDQSDNEDTVPQTTLKLEQDSLSDAEEDTGVDPYNTGRFDTKNK